MAFNFFFRRASSSILIRSYQRDNVQNTSRCGGLVVGQFRLFVRFLTGAAAENTSAKSPSAVNDDELTPFAVKDGPEKGTLTLARKFEDEIVRIDVRVYQNYKDYLDAECEKYYEIDDAYPYKSQCENDIDKLKNPDELVEVNPCLHLEVKCYYGDKYKKRMMFDVVVFPDSNNKIMIRYLNVSFVKPPGERLHEREYHLDDLEPFLKNRGIELKSMTFLFHHFQKLSQVETRFSSTFTNNNLSTLLESKSVPNLRDGSSSPFIFEHCSDGTILLKSKFQNEEIFVNVHWPDQHDVEHPTIPMFVYVIRGEQELYIEVYVKPKRIRIQNLTISNVHTEHLENFEEFIRSKGINSGLINMVCDRLGIKRKNNTTTANPL